MTDTTAPDLSPDATLARVEAVFAPGPLAAKRAELEALRDSGDSLLFDGAVDWTLFLTDSERRLSGYALSLDDAFGDIIACLDHLAASEAPDSEIAFAVSMAEEQEEDNDENDTTDVT